MIKTNKDGQVPYTPVLPLLYGMQASMKLMRAEGFENVIKRHHRYVVAVCTMAKIAGQIMFFVYSSFCLSVSLEELCIGWCALLSTVCPSLMMCFIRDEHTMLSKKRQTNAQLFQ